MSAPSTMTCDRASQLITELVCGELEADVAASVRAHAENCPNCGPELARFARVLAVAQELPLDTPSPAVDQRIMQAAREAMSRRAGGAVAIDSGSPGGSIKAWLERLGTWAMSPQVAMASVLLLVVGIGMYALPFGEDASAPSALRLAQEPESPAAPQPTAAATAAPQAEEEAEGAALERAARGDGPADLLEAGEKSKAAAFPADARNASAAKEAPTKKRASAESKGGSSNKVSGLDDFGLLDSALGGEGLTDGVAGGSASVGKASGSMSAPKPAPTPKPTTAEREEAFAPPPPEPRQRSRDVAAPAAEPAAPAPVASESSDARAVSAQEVLAARPAKDTAESSRSQVSYADLLAAGIQAAQTGNYAQAVASLEPVVASGPVSMRTSARTWLARSLRSLGQCERALTHYAPLVDAPAPPAAILNEAADCYSRVGRVAEAEALRMRSKAGAAPKAAPAEAPAAAPRK